MTCIIDSDFFFFYILYEKKGREEKTEAEVIWELNHFLRRILIETQCNNYICALTSKSFRYSIDSNYKANRKYKEKHKHFDALKNYAFNTLGFIKHDGLEADDIVNICKIRMDAQSIPNIIASTDKDILTCIPGRHYNPIKKQFINTTVEEAEYNFNKSMLTGDSGDNIKGVRKIGDVGACKILDPIKESIRDQRTIVFNTYISTYGYEEGVDEYYKNFKCLRLLSDFNDFQIPEVKELV